MGLCARRFIGNTSAWLARLLTAIQKLLFFPVRVRNVSAILTRANPICVNIFFFRVTLVRIIELIEPRSKLTRICRYKGYVTCNVFDQNLEHVKVAKEMIISPTE